VDADQKQRARRALMATATAPQRRSWWSAPGRLRTAVVALVVAVLAIGLPRGPFSVLGPIDPAAAAALRQAATVAAGAHALDFGDGYIYTKTQALWGFQASDWRYLRPLVREDWMARDGSGRTREKVGKPIFLSEADRKAWEASGSKPFAFNHDFGPGELEPQFGNASLPTEVDPLREAVRELAAASHPWPRTDGQMFVVIRDLLRDPLTPPAVRAALFQVAASLPGIALLGDVTDRVGRPGVGIAMSNFLLHVEIVIFDPATSDLLEERTLGVLPYGDTAPPITWGWSTYLETRVVSEMPAE
jgi:hypothetical protein